MMHFKQHKQGFTLIEVLLALSVASIVLIPVFTVQGRIIKQIVLYADQLQALFFGQSFFNEQRLEALINKNDPYARAEKKIVQPELTLTYVRKKAEPGSSLTKLDNIYLEQTTIQWTDIDGPQQEMLVSCLFQPGDKS